VTIPRGHISPDVHNSIYKAVGWEVLARTGMKWHEMARNGVKNLDWIA
jgi:hypothetical protein